MTRIDCVKHVPKLSAVQKKKKIIKKKKKSCRELEKSANLGVNLKRLTVQLIEARQDTFKTRGTKKGVICVRLVTLACVCVCVCKRYLEMSGSLHLAYLDTTCLCHSNDDRLASLSVCASPAPVSSRGGCWRAAACARTCAAVTRQLKEVGKKKGQSKV